MNNKKETYQVTTKDLETLKFFANKLSLKPWKLIAGEEDVKKKSALIETAFKKEIAIYGATESELDFIIFIVNKIDRIITDLETLRTV